MPHNMLPAGNVARRRLTDKRRAIGVLHYQLIQLNFRLKGSRREARRPRVAL
jgi:hypothetical protein